MEREPSIDEKRAIIYGRLEQERELWLPAHQRAERSGHMNRVHNAQENRLMKRINRLLDGLIELSPVEETLENTVPAE